MPRWSGAVVVEMKPWQGALYRFVRAAVAGFSKAFWRVEVWGLERIPAEGPFIISPVHRSNIDTPLVALMGKRRLRFMG
jgi:1-acyl-sn-glycerol-3-phosphate acyltransferase